MKIIGIAGGSGAGKSAVAYALIDAQPEMFEVLNLDDYHKLRTEPSLPMLAGMINWDHPDIIRWDDLITDIQKLKRGQEITINTWSHRSNPDYVKSGQLIPRTIKPKPVLIVEGYLTLYRPESVKLFDKTFYLDLDEASRHARRGKDKTIGYDSYKEKVLRPMHDKYVEPTKLLADVVLDAAELNVEQISDIVRASLS